MIAGFAALVTLAAIGRGPDADPGAHLGLADLPAYAEALAGRPTSAGARPSDPPVEVGFRALWERPDDYLGRRVTIRGKLERTFRQGPVGRFPPLAESWIFSPVGDPICAVYPRSPDDRREAPGRPVRFTGTFLRTIRYPAGEGERLAPLIVGDRPPAPDASRPDDARGRPRRALPSPSGNNALALALLAIAAVLVAFRHVRPGRRRPRPAPGRPVAPVDPPLEFLEPPDDQR